VPFARPTLDDLIGRARTDIEARLPGTDARLRHSNLDVLARVHAAAVHGLYGYLAWAARQVLVDTAEAESLARHAAVWGVTRLPASYAEGGVSVTGESGAVVPTGTSMLRSDGAEFVSTADATLASGTATVQVTALLAGAAGNAVVSTGMTLVLPVAGVSGTAAVATGGLVGGADAESDDALRARVLYRIQQPPMGGAAHDYVAWALEVAGVTRAWVYPLELGVGTVVVRFVRDNDVSMIPDGGEVSAVQTYIDARRPVTAQVTVAAPTADPLDLTIDITPDTAAVRTAIQLELEDLLRREAAPGGTILLSHLREAISVAAGETDHTLSSPTADVTHSVGSMAVLGTITWV